MKRTCNTCEEEFPLTTDYFHRHKRMKDGFRPICKVCRKQKEPYDSVKYMEYYNANKEIINSRKKEYWREYYKENEAYKIEYNKQYRKENIEKIKLRLIEYNRINKKEIRAKGREYYLKNKVEIARKQRPYQRRHYQLNKDRIRMYHQARRASEKESEASLTVEQWRDCKEHFNNSCAYCGKEPDIIHREHFVPHIQGGEFTINNIVPACISCNSSKGCKNFFEWYPEHKNYSKERERIILKYLNYNGNIQQLSIL